jgi:hypothetical protein
VSIVNGGGPSIVPAALFLSAAVFLGVIAFIGVFVIVVVANRADPDPTGRRPLAVYLFAVSFFSVFVLLFGTYAIVSGVVQLIGTHPAPVSSSAQHPVGDAVTRVVVLGGLIVAVAVVLLSYSLRRALDLPELSQSEGGPVVRVAQSYAASVSFIAVFIASVSVVVFVYQALRILAPGVFELTATRVVAARTLLSTFYLAAASSFVVFAHTRLLPDSGWRPRRPQPMNAGAPAFAPPTPGV